MSDHIHRSNKLQPGFYIYLFKEKRKKNENINNTKHMKQMVLFIVIKNGFNYV